MVAGGDIFTKGVTIGMEVTAYEEIFTQDIKRNPKNIHTHVCTCVKAGNQLGGGTEPSGMREGIVEDRWGE